MIEKSDPKVSIVVLAFDSPSYLDKTLRSIAGATDYSNFELIVSNNSIGLPVEKDIDKMCNDAINYPSPNRYVHVKNDKNLLHGKGCMAGAEQVDPKSEFICFCNDDIFIPFSQSDWLTKLVEFLVERPNVASVTPSLYSVKERVYWLGKQDPKKPHHDYLHLPKGDLRLPTEPTVTCYNNMAIMLTRTKLVREIPLGQNCPHYGSDSEFANRIKEKYPDTEHYVLPYIKLYHYNIYAQRVNHGQDKKIEG